MKVLLDTNALLWLALDPDKVAQHALAQLADPATDLHVSAAAAWEIAIKTRAGKLPGGEKLLSVWDETCAGMRVGVIDITAADAVLAGRLAWAHRDPFDRMMVAQAARRGFTIASSDTTVLTGALTATIDTRT